jgi:KaiC/GvpD/RAD55 family RecA-like ATPase
MPTFQSIQMHPELRTRLVTESSSIGLPRNPASSTNNGADSSTLTQQNPFQPIETPQALLSRHPGSLRIIDSTGSRSRPIALPQANNLRHDVAQALIATSKYGRFLHNVHERSKDQADCPISPFRVSGTISVLEMLQEKARESEFPTLTTGSFSLDRLLSFPKEYSVAPSAEMTLNHSSDPHSGIPFGYVTQFSGPPGCGKSQVALQVASSTANIKTWYLSSNPSLRSYAQRLSQLVKHYPQSVQFDVLTRTDFLSVGDEHQLLAALADIEHSLESGTVAAPNCLLVFDSASGCLNSDSPFLTISNTLRRVARRYRVAVVITNGSVSHRSGDDGRLSTPKPALGKFWKAADIQVWAELTRSGGETHCRLEKHPAKRISTESSQVGRFRVDKRGVQDTEPSS